MRRFKILSVFVLVLLLFAAVSEAGTRYVSSSSGSSSYSGVSRKEPCATIYQAEALASTGDTIIAMAGHSETYTGSAGSATGPVVIDVADLTIRGEGRGSTIPTISSGNAAYLYSITAQGVTIENIALANANDAYSQYTAVSYVRVDAADFRLRNVQADANGYAYTILELQDGATRAIIEGNRFSVSSNGPSTAVWFQGAAADVSIRDNIFDGGSATNAWDSGAIFIDTGVTPEDVEEYGNVYKHTYFNNVGDGITSCLPNGYCIATTRLVALTGGSVASIFTLTGGPIAADVIVMEITTSVSANACGLTLTVNPTTGADTAIGTTIDINARTAGQFLSWSGASGAITSALGVPATALVVGAGQPIIFPQGTIDLTLANSDPTTGAARFRMLYRPLAAGARVLAY